LQEHHKSPFKIDITTAHKEKAGTSPGALRYICKRIYDHKFSTQHTACHSPNYAVGCSTLSGTTGFTSTQAFSKSSTTFGPVFLPISVISFSFSSVSFSACVSASLLPDVCCVER